MGRDCLTHHAFVHDSDDEYVARTVAYVNEALEAGEGAVVVAASSRLSAVREALGADRGVLFRGAADAYVRPSLTIRDYRHTLAELLQTRPAVRVMGELFVGPTRREQDEWMAYDAILNHAFADMPVRITCAYDSQTIPDRVLDAVWESHPHVWHGQLEPSDRFADPASVVRALTPAPKDLPDLRSVPIPKDVEGVRERLTEALAAEEVGPQRALDAILAVSEVAENAWRHGGGLTGMRVGPAGGRFVCELSDRGSGLDDPLAGYAPLAGPDGRGSGLWVARQLAWRLELGPAAPGLTARVWV